MKLTPLERRRIVSAFLDNLAKPANDVSRLDMAKRRALKKCARNARYRAQHSETHP